MAAATSSSGPAAAATAGPGPTATDKVSMLTCVRQALSGTVAVLQEAPLAVATETAGLMQEVPLVGIVCKTFLSFEKLVDTARSNKEDLAVLRDLCDVVIEGVLDKRSDRSVLLKGFKALENHTKRAKEVAKLCNGRVKPFLLASKICRDIAAVRKDVLDICTANELVLANDLHVQTEKNAKRLEAMEKELRVSGFLGRSVVVGCLAIGVAVLAFGGSPEITPKFDDNKEFGSTTKDLEDRDNDLTIRDKASLDLAVELLGKHESWTARETELQEQRKIADVATTVKIPSGAPRIQYWYVEREAVVSEACDRLGVGNSTSLSSEEPRMVGLAGPSGVGKSTAASMVAGRADVRAHFHTGVLWLQVGQGAKRRLPELMTRLAGMVYETVMLKQCRPLRKAGSENDPEDGAAYIREVVDEKSRRFLVVADDVWERDVLEELKRAGVMWVLYTTRQDTLLPEQAPQRLDEMLPNEAELVLRRAADLDDNARLPEAAYDLMNRCEFVVLDLAMVGRWGMVRGRRDDEKVWRMALNRIVEAQKGGGDEKALSWRAAVLRAGLEELASDNPQNKELYLSLAVIPKGLSFPREAAAVLLCGDDLSAQDLEAAGRVMATLERWSILTVEDGGLHRVHDEHAEFIQGRLAANQDARVTALSRWRGYASSVRALFAFSSVELVKIWDEVERVGGEDVPLRPYDAALDALDPSSAEYAGILEKTADFHLERQDWLECRTKYSKLLPDKENDLGIDHLDVATTLSNCGICANMVWRLEEAAEFHRRALAIREEKLGVDHPDVAYTLNELGVCASKERRMEEAEDFYRRALAIQEEKLGVAHPCVARTLSNLGSCALTVDRIGEADELLRRALAIREEKLGADHPDVASSLHDLGWCALQAGRMKEAEGLLRRVLAIREEKLGVDHPDVASTLNELGVCACKVGRMDEAEEFHRRALAIREEQLGVDHPIVARTLYDLGVCVSEVGRMEEAEEFLRRTLEIEEEKLGVDHPDVASTLNELGVCASKGGRMEEAEEFHRRALAIQEEKLGVAHPCVARTLSNLGSCALTVDRIGEADELLRRALAIREEKLGVDHPDVASSLHDLGWCALQAGRMKEAEECYRRALTIRKEKLGVDHPDVACSLHSLGVCACKVGRMDEAEEFHRRALAIREEQLGVDHPDVARTLYDLGVCASKAGRMKEAEEFLRRTLEIEEEKLGVDHQEVAYTLNELGVCASKGGRMEEAEEFHRRALAIQEEKLGVDHPDVARTLTKLGSCALAVGQMEEAEEFHRRALAIREDTLGVDHPEVAHTLNNLGWCAFNVGRMEEAEEFHRRELAIREEKLGVDHPDVAYSLHSLGWCAYKAGRIKDAEELNRRALAIQEEKLGVDHPDVALTLHNLGLCAWKTSRTAKAEELHRRELGIREEKLGEDHPDVADTLHWLAVNVGDAGRKEEAEKLFRQALAIRDEKLGVNHWDTAITRKALAELRKSTLAVVTQTVAALLAGVVLYVTISARCRGEVRW